MSHPVTIEMLGGLCVRQGDLVIARFRTQKTAVLLAYLACYLHRRHAREELIELLWPESDLDLGRTSLRTALASLRRQLEPPGTPEGSLLVADRLHVSLNADAVTTDLQVIENAARTAPKLSDPAERAKILSDAAERYRGHLLPGFYDDWALRERERIQTLYIDLLRDLVLALEECGEFQRAIEVAHKAVAADSLNEEAHTDLMRLYAATGQISAVSRQFRELERVLNQEMKTKPSVRSRSLYEKILQRAEEESAPAEEASLPAVPKPATGEEEDSAPIPAASPQASVRSAPIASAVKPTSPSRPLPELPIQLTRFVGREEELNQLEQLLQPGVTRLVTLTGPGGTGKTRLSLEAAQRLFEAYGGEVAIVPLADLEDAERLPDTVAAALQLPRLPEGDPMDPIVERLTGRPFLLALDNFEQLAEEGTPFLMKLLARVPSLSLLVTSRQRLNLGVERHFPVPPLPIPDIPGSPESLIRLPSVRLFVDRAQAARPDFQITRENAAAIAALCERLEGLPLALELAAAWAQTLTPAQMLNRMDRRFDLLTSRRKDIPSRHRTLRDAVEWSYHLLEPPMQRFFTRMAIFRGSWSIDAAEKVGEDPRALDILQELQDRSLIVTEENVESQMRFRLLETIREYALEQLSPEERERAARLHMEYYLSLAEITRPELEGPNQTVWMGRLEQNMENYRAALEWAKAEPEWAEAGLKLAALFQFFWYVRGYYKEGYGHLVELLEKTEPLLSDPDRSPQLLRIRVQALQGAGELASAMGELARAQAHFEECLELNRGMDHRSGVADALNYLGIVIEAQGDRARARELFEESLAIWRELGDRGGIAHTLKSLGGAMLAHGDARRAREMYEEGTALYREIGNPRGLTMMLGEQARLALAQGEYHRADDLLREYLRMAQVLRDQSHVVAALDGLGQVAWNRGDYPQARAYYEDGLKIARELGSRLWVVAAYHHLGEIASEQGEYAAAARLFEQGLQLAREIGDRNNIAALLDSMGVIHCHRGDYSNARASYEESLALYRDLGDRWGIARVLRHTGNAASEAGDLETARRSFEESLEIARELEDRHAIGMALYDLGDIARQQGDLQAARERWEEVRSMDEALGIKGGSVLGALGSLAAAQGDFEEAHRLWLESLCEHREIGDRKGMAECLEALAALQIEERQREAADSAEKDPGLIQAVRLLGTAESLRKSLGSPLPVNRQSEHQRRLDALQEILGAAVFTSAWTEGRAMEMEQALQHLQPCDCGEKARDTWTI